MPKAAEKREVHKIEREYERKGYSTKRSKYIADATVYGAKKHHHRTAKAKKAKKK